MSDSGPTHDWCSRVGKEFKCYVVASFPEKMEDSGRAYLSQMVVNREGRVVGVHRNGFEGLGLVNSGLSPLVEIDSV